MSEKKQGRLVPTRALRNPVSGSAKRRKGRTTSTAANASTAASTAPVPLPEGVTLEDVKATFSDGVLEVCVPLPARSEASVRKVQIEEPKTAAKSAA